MLPYKVGTMKNKNYSIIVVTGATSTNKEFVISSKLIKNSIIAFSVLLLIFGFVIFDYLTISFDKEKMKRLEKENVEKAQIISELHQRFDTLDHSLKKMQKFKDRIMVATGWQSPYALNEVGSGGFDSETGAPVQNISGDIEIQTPLELAQPLKPTNEQILDKARSIAQNAQDTEKMIKFVEQHIYEQKEKLASTPALWPTRGYLTDGFGNRVHPITGKVHFHTGLDIATQLGNKVIATADGFVLFSAENNLMGKLVEIDHGFGFTTRYGHLSSYIVKEGDRVKRGQVIGYVGNTGRSTAPHLHYEVLYQNKHQSPMNYIFD